MFSYVFTAKVCGGFVAEIGANVRGWSVGDRAMALLAGGGYAEEVVVDSGSAMHVPDALSDEEAAALPEVFLTAFLNIFLLARILVDGADIRDHPLTAPTQPLGKYALPERDWSQRRTEMFSPIFPTSAERVEISSIGGCSGANARSTSLTPGMRSVSTCFRSVM